MSFEENRGLVDQPLIEGFLYKITVKTWKYTNL